MSNDNFINHVDYAKVDQHSGHSEMYSAQVVSLCTYI